MGEKFDYVISNPPYQEAVNDNNRSRPIYPDFIDAGRLVAHTSIMIHPARFLSNSGETKKAWNEKIVKSPEFLVLEHFSNSSHIFPSVDIKGGIAITKFEQGQS
jgi:23S rRNA G2445 N2-methylase RlmL